MKENKKKENDVFCSIEYFMKHKCNGCKLERECEEWDCRTKRHSDNRNDDNSSNSSKSQR